MGLDTVGARLTAPRLDRPIIQLCYELAPLAGAPIPESGHFTDRLDAAFGAPREAESYDIPANGNPSGSVRYYAGWEAGDCSVGLSLYGGPRPTEFGLAPGCLWLSWSPVMAARPYLAERRARAQALAGREPRELSGFRFAAEQLPVFSTGYSSAPGYRDASYALYHPELLPTPAAVSAMVGSRGAAFWRCDGNHWCASTAWDTLVIADDASVEISWNDIAPAKGGGFSEIAIGRWTVRDWHNSASIRRAVRHIEKAHGVRVNHLTGYDC